MSVRDYEAFGKLIFEARKQKNLSLKQCADIILKEDGNPISFQYLSEIENARRNPPSEPILKQLAQVLDIPIEILYIYSKTISSEIPVNQNKDILISAYRDFISKIGQKEYEVN